MAKIPAFPKEELLALLGARAVRGALSGGVSAVSEPGDATSDSVAFLINESFVKDAIRSHAGILIVQKSILEKVLPQLPDSIAVVAEADDAYAALAKLTKLVVDRAPDLDWVGGSAEHKSWDSRFPGAWVSTKAEVHASARIFPGVTVGDGAKVGAGSVLFPGVCVYPRCLIGARVRLHANVVIGGDGFGYARTPVGAQKIYHLGIVKIGDDVEVGPGTTIDRGTIRDTIIENGAKIDNQVQVGHNGHIRAHAVICAQVGMAGNVTVGQGTILAGGAGIADKVVIGDGAIIGPHSGISKDVEPKQIMMGAHVARPRKEWWRLLAYFDRLPELFDRVKKLEKEES